MERNARLGARLPRRHVLIGGAFGLSAALLAACGQPTAPATTVPATAAPASGGAAPTAAPKAAATVAPAAATSKARLTYLHLDDANLKAVRKSIVDAYNQQAAAVGTAEEIVVAHDQLETKRNALFAAGTPPDVFVGQGGSQNISALKEVLLDLSPLITRDQARAQTDKYYPRTLEYVRYEGKTLQWPCYPIVMVLGYNKDLFDAAGVAYPTNNWTYDNLIEAARKLTKMDASGKPEQWGVTVDRRSYIEWLNGIWARGGNAFSDDLKKLLLSEKPGLDTLKWMFDKINTHKVSPGPGQDIQAGFVGGKYAMDWGTHAGSWGALRKAGLKWDVVMLPKGPVERGPRIAMDTWSLARTSKNPDAAWDFLMFANSPEQATKFAEAGFPPSRRDVAEATWLKGAVGSRASDPQNVQNYFDSMEHVRHVQHSKHFLKVTLDIVAPQLDLLFEQKKTIEQAAADATREANEFLASQTAW
jgi:multiple sugar transport system substrate-binding protein